MILVKPNGGLGNRLRVIHSSMVLAGLKGERSLEVLWKKDAGLQANFLDLFMPIDGVGVEQNFLRMAIRFYIRKVICNDYYMDDDAVKEKQHDTHFWRQIPANIILNTCMDFHCQNEQNHYHKFVPKPEIFEQIERLTNKFTSDTVGVHIRRTDNMPAMRNSPTEKFFIELHKIIDESPVTTFFLATDDASLEEQISSKFSGRMIVQENKERGRNSPEGIKAAVVDLFALSKAKFILGSHGSSFGEVASLIGRNKLRIV